MEKIHEEKTRVIIHFFISRHKESRPAVENKFQPQNSFSPLISPD